MEVKAFDPHVELLRPIGDYVVPLLSYSLFAPPPSFQGLGDVYKPVNSRQCGSVHQSLGVSPPQAIAALGTIKDPGDNPLHLTTPPGT